MLAQRLDHALIGLRALRRRQVAFGEHDGAQPQRLAGAHHAALRIVLRDAALLDAMAERPPDRIFIDCGGGRYARILRLALQVCHDQIGRTGERIGGLQHAAAAVRQHEPTALAARLGHAIRPGVEKQRADISLRRARRFMISGSFFSRPRQPLRELSGRRRPWRAVAAKAPKAALQVGTVSAQPAFRDQHRDVGRSARGPVMRRLRHHMRKAHRQSEPAHLFAGRGQAAVFAQRAQRHEQRPRLCQSWRGRRVEKGEPTRVRDAERGAVEQQRGKIGLKDFRLAVG